MAVPQGSKEAPASTAAISQPSNPSDGNPVAVYKYIKEARDSLGKRPTKEEVESASQAVLSIVSDLEKQIEDLATQNVPWADGLPSEGEGLLALKKFKEDVYRSKAQMALLPHVAVLELDKSFRHYDAAVQVAEQALLTGKSSSGWMRAVAELEHEPHSSLMLPTPVLSLSLPHVFGGTPAAPYQYTPAEEDTGLHVSYVPADEPPAHGPASRGIGTSTAAAAAAGAAANALALSTGTRPQTGVANGGPRVPLAMSPPGSHTGHSAGAASGFYSPGSVLGNRALQTRTKLKATGHAASDIFRVPAPAQEMIPMNATEEGAEPRVSIVLNSLLLKIIQDSVQNRPRTLDIRGHLFDAPLQLIPETLGFVDSLVDLNVAENQLVVLPESIGSLKKLQTLDASCNELLELPRSIGDLKELQELDLHHNKIEELPVTLGGCTALEILHLEFNKLKGLPIALGQLKKLRILTLALNTISILPYTMGQMEGLVELDVHHNQLQGLPESIGHLKNLQKLNISANHFDLQVLPKSIGQLENLRELDLRENHIHVLPQSVSLLTNLKKLQLEGNPWQSPPMEVTQKGLEAVMEYLKEAKEEEEERPGSSRGGNVFSRLFRVGHRKTEANIKLDNFKTHANTWGA